MRRKIKKAKQKKAKKGTNHISKKKKSCSSFLFQKEDKTKGIGER